MRFGRQVFLVAAMMMAAPWVVRADVVFTQRLNSTVTNSGPNYVSPFTYLESRLHSDFNLGNPLDLNGASGNLVVQLLAPVGKQIEVVTDIDTWSTALVISGFNGFASFTNVPVTVSFVDLSGGTPSISSNGGTVAEAQFTPGQLNYIQLNTSDSGLPAGTRFSGVSYTVSIAAIMANFTGAELLYSQDANNPSANFRFSVVRSGDQTQTLPSEAVRYVDVSDVPEPGTGLLVLAVLGICGLVRGRGGW